MTNKLGLTAFSHIINNTVSKELSFVDYITAEFHGKKID
jgi:hypothetical protein